MGWGGAYLWCGRSGGFPASYHEAERLPFMFNTASLYLVHAHTLHAVELVERSDDQEAYRFGMSSWLRTSATYVDLHGHQESLKWRQFQESRASPHRLLTDGEL